MKTPEAEAAETETAEAETGIGHAGRPGERRSIGGWGGYGLWEGRPPEAIFTSAVVVGTQIGSMAPDFDPLSPLIRHLHLFI